jgi:hypothetical protein
MFSTNLVLKKYQPLKHYYDHKKTDYFRGFYSQLAPTQIKRRWGKLYLSTTTGGLSLNKKVLLSQCRCLGDLRISRRIGRSLEHKLSTRLGRTATGIRCFGGRRGLGSGRSFGGAGTAGELTDGIGSIFNYKLPTRLGRTATGIRCFGGRRGLGSGRSFGGAGTAGELTDSIGSIFDYKLPTRLGRTATGIRSFGGRRGLGSGRSFGGTGTAGELTDGIDRSLHGCSANSKGTSQTQNGKQTKLHSCIVVL